MQNTEERQKELRFIEELLTQAHDGWLDGPRAGLRYRLPSYYYKMRFMLKRYADNAKLYQMICMQREHAEVRLDACDGISTKWQAELDYWTKQAQAFKEE